MSTLTIDASALDGIVFSTYIADQFAGLSGAGSNEFFGGVPDRVFGSVYYLNGSQILSRYADASGADQSPTTVLIDGENLAYDYLHYGAAYGHGISGAVDSLTFGAWIDGVTTGTQGIGAAGRISGLDTGLVIEGFDLFAAPGSGFDPAANPVYALYAAVRDKNADAIYDLISQYDLHVTGSAGDDSLNGYAGEDVLRGMGGNDLIDGSEGDDKLYGGSGKDALYGGAGDDVLVGGAGKDKLWGGEGDDLFVFAPGSGCDKIMDFELGADLIDLRRFDLASFDDVTVRDAACGAKVLVEDVAFLVKGVEAADLGVDQLLI